MLWYGKPVAEKLEAQVVQFVQTHGLANKYLGIIMPGVAHPGAAYVRSKIKCAERIGLTVKVFGENEELTDVDILNVIHTLADDKECIGIIVQLPLPVDLQKHQARILNAIPGYKDVDGLGLAMQQITERYPLYFTPATPRAVLSLLEYYAYDVEGKHIAMLGHSDLIGKPLAIALKARGAHVEVFTIESDQQQMKQYCREKAEMIISATGHIHLVNEEFVRDDKSQVVIDVGRGYKDDKAIGDVQRENLQDKVYAITPVPGGVGPVTVASLFANIISLHENSELFSSFFIE